MPMQFTVIDQDGLHNFESIPGLEKASAELINIITYVNNKHPELSSSQAGYVAAYFLHHIPQLIDKNPELMKVIEQTVKYVRNSELS